MEDASDSVSPAKEEKFDRGGKDLRRGERLQEMWRQAPVDGFSRDDADRYASSILWYGPLMSHEFLHEQVKAYRNLVRYVNLVSVLDCSVINWVEQQELKGLARD